MFYLEYSKLRQLLFFGCFVVDTSTRFAYVTHSQIIWTVQCLSHRFFVLYEITALSKR